MKKTNMEVAPVFLDLNLAQVHGTRICTIKGMGKNTFIAIGYLRQGRLGTLRFELCTRKQKLRARIEKTPIRNLKVAMWSGAIGRS